MVDFSGGLASAKFIGDSLRAVANLAVDHKVRVQVNEAISRVVDVQNSLLEAQLVIGEQIDEIRSLRAEIAKHDNWLERSNAYQLVRTNQNAVIYQYKADPKHFACPVCFEDHVIVPLQESNSRYSGAAACRRCKATYLTRDSEDPNLNFRSGF